MTEALEVFCAFMLMIQSVVVLVFRFEKHSQHCVVGCRLQSGRLVNVCSVAQSMCRTECEI